jgi:thioester reductase-like protein
MKPKILLTGATTLIGAELLNNLLQRDDIETVVLLSTSQDLAHLEHYLGPLPASVIPLEGDYRLLRFGLTLDQWEELGRSLSIGFHCAQREASDQNLEAARQHNVRPLETWIELLHHNPTLRLNHLSTAFVAGTRRGMLTEFDLNCGQSFNNAWERSKFEAEVLLRKSDVAARVTVYRPSSVLGCEKTGKAFELAGAYPLLATLAGASILPGDAQARLDFVPADFVASSLATLALSGAAGTFHLACGWRKSITVRCTVDLVARGQGRPSGGRLLPRALTYPLRLTGSKALGGLASRTQAFAIAHHQLHQNAVFDTFLADLALRPMGITAPEPEHRLEACVRAAEQQHWRSTANSQLALQH